MKKIGTNLLVVLAQLMVGGLFLFVLFSDNSEDNKVAVVENDNLNKMADVVSELFVEETSNVVEEIVEVEVELTSIEDEIRKAEEEARAKEEAEKQAALEEAARKAEEEKQKAAQSIVVDATGYISNSALGFNVTTGNKTYSLSESDFAILATVVNCEANRSSKDDILAVMSVILNRADRNGTDPVSVVAAPYQFSCYTGSGSSVSSTVSSVMTDALNGIRNNSYLGFNSWYNTSYSNNYIVEGGNRYR